MLEDRLSDDRKPLSVRAGMVRQLATTDFRARVASTVDDVACVVGDPLTEKFIPLPGAEAEARLVAGLLREGLEPRREPAGEAERRGVRVESQVRADARSIVQALHARAYRVLHLAGHGVHEYALADPDRLACETCGQARPGERPLRISGRVLGDDVFLTPADVEQVRQVPELVFVNCCHLGRTDVTRQDSPRADRHRFAANIAAQFIRMGVRAVVAAGWAVDDAAAKTFARTFYEGMLDGQQFGEAVHSARTETWRQHPSVNTWGAYQCYGDPSYTLRARTSERGGLREWRYFAPAEAVVDLENLASAAQTASDEEIQRSRRDLEAIRGRMDASWARRGDVAAALGIAHGELGDFEAAIVCLRQALQSDDAGFPVLAIEQLANFGSRWAVELWKRAGAAPPGETKEKARVQAKPSAKKKAPSRAEQPEEGQSGQASSGQAQAEQQAQSGQTQSPADMVAQAIGRLDTLEQVIITPRKTRGDSLAGRGPTIERLCLLGAACRSDRSTH